MMNILRFISTIASRRTTVSILVSGPIVAAVLAISSCAPKQQSVSKADTATGTVVAPSSTSTTPTKPALRSYQANINTKARTNHNYRQVLFTGEKSQLVVMSIPPGGDIGLETHPHVEQTIVVQSGTGTAYLNAAKSPLKAGDVLVITPGTPHNVVNTGKVALKLYTIYTPPNHIDGRVHATKAAAEVDHADEAFGADIQD